MFKNKKFCLCILSLVILVIISCGTAVISEKSTVKKWGSNGAVDNIVNNEETPYYSETSSVRELISSCDKNQREVWLSYNVQNLFDETTDGTEYPNMKWSQEKSIQKIGRLSEVFTKIAEDYGSYGVVLLQEVENKGIVEKLRDNVPSLKGFNIAFEKENDQAIGLAVLTRYPIKKIETLKPTHFHTGINITDSNKKAVRPIQLVTITGPEEEDVTIMNVHLPSQKTTKSNVMRHDILVFLSRHLKDILAQGKSIFLGGDFNEDILPLSHNIFPQSNPQKKPLTQKSLLVNTHSFLPQDTRESLYIGTYFYKGQWKKIDHLLFSHDFFDEKGLDYDSSLIYKNDKFLKTESPFKTPKEFNENTKKGTGYSDHLPVVSLVCKKPLFNA